MGIIQENRLAPISSVSIPTVGIGTGVFHFPEENPKVGLVMCFDLFCFFNIFIGV